MIGDTKTYLLRVVKNLQRFKLLILKIAPKITILKLSRFNPTCTKIFCEIFTQSFAAFWGHSNILKTRELPGVALVNCAISHILTIIQIKLLKQSFLFISSCMDAPYVRDHILEGKACIKNPKTCGGVPSKWPPLTNGMSYSYGTVHFSGV